MTKKRDYIIGISFSLCLCVLWALSFLGYPLWYFINLMLLLAVPILYYMYCKRTTQHALACLMIIPLMLWFVMAKAQWSSIYFIGLISTFLCCTIALRFYLLTQKSAVN